MLLVNNGCATRRLSCSRTSTALGRDSAKIVSFSDCGDIPILHSSARMNESAATAQDLHTVLAISFQRGHSRSHRVPDDFAPAELGGIPYHSKVLRRNHVSYIPFESRAIPLNILKNNGLMACASGRLPEICLRGSQGTHARPLKKISA